MKRGVRLDESGGSDTEDDDFDFNTEDEEIELELEIEAVEAEADVDDADQNEEESESSADEESDGDDNDEIEFEEGFIDDDEDDSEEEDLIDDELENSEAASNFTSLGSDHGDSDAVIDEIEKYNFLYVFSKCILCRQFTQTCALIFSDLTKNLSNSEMDYYFQENFLLSHVLDFTYGDYRSDEYDRSGLL